MTNGRTEADNRKKEAPKSDAPDQRLVALVRLLAKQAADEDFAEHMKQLDTAPPSSNNEEER